MPVRVTTEQFEELVAEALDTIPDELARHIENVVVVVADRATPEQQHGHAGMLLGLYQGVMLTDRSPLSYSGVMPDRITVFMEPHLAIAGSIEELRRRIAVTVVHEIGHHFGISDDRLHELGWS